MKLLLKAWVDADDHKPYFVEEDAHGFITWSVHASMARPATKTLCDALLTYRSEWRIEVTPWEGR